MMRANANVIKKCAKRLPKSFFPCRIFTLNSNKQAYYEASLSNQAGGRLILKHSGGNLLSGMLFLEHSGVINGRNAPRNAISKAFRCNQWTECFSQSTPVGERNGMLTGILFSEHSGGQIQWNDNKLTFLNTCYC